MVRTASALALCDSVVAVQDLFASSVSEFVVCTQSATLEEKYAVIASSMSGVKRIALEEGSPLLLHRRLLGILGRAASSICRSTAHAAIDQGAGGDNHDQQSFCDGRGENNII
jgi:hypothetical protein